MNALPTVSVIVPVYNDAQRLALCLDALAAQDYPSELVDVVVIDNASTDNTEEVMQTFLAKYAYATANSPDIPVLYIRETREGKELLLWSWAHSTRYRWYRATELLTWAVMTRAMERGCETYVTGTGSRQRRYRQIA